MTVIGLDVSSTSTGVALGPEVLTTIAPKHSDPLRRLHAFEEELERQFDRVRHSELVTIEAYLTHGLRGLSAVRLAEFGGVARLAAFRRAIPILEVNLSVVKIWATGKGNAKKPDIVAAARAEGANPANDDEADAYFLAQIGASVLWGEPTVVNLDPRIDFLRCEKIEILRKGIR